MRGFSPITPMIFGWLLLSFSTGTTEAQIRFTNVATWPGYSRGDPNSLALDGNYAYATIGVGGLAVLDMSNPTNPVRVASYDLLPDIPYDVAVKDGYAYVIGEWLHVLDISNPLAPVEVAQTYAPGVSQHMSIENDKLYSVNWSGLRVVDIGNPDTPVAVGHHPIGNVGYWAKAAVKDGLAYVAAGQPGLVVVDVSNPTNMTSVGTFASDDYPSDVRFKGNYAYLAGRGGLVVMNVTNPASPVRVWGSNNRNEYVYGIALSAAGDHAYVACVDGLYIFDIANPTNVVALGKHGTSQAAVDVAMRGAYAHIIVEREGLQVIDISDPLHPRLAALHELSGYTDDVQKVGNLLYVSDRVGGLRIMELSASGLNEIGRFRPTSGQVLQSKIIGNRAYLACDQGGFQIVDVSNPRNPVLLGKAQPWNQCMGLDVVGNYAYLGFGDRMHIVDIRDPRNPVTMPNPYTNSSPWYVKVRGDYAYIPAYDRQLVIVNVSDPSHPVEVGTIITNDFSPGTAVELKDQYAYVLDWYRGLTIVDVTQPANPVVRGRFNSYAASGLYISGNYAFISTSSSGGVEVVDISNPSRPTLVGRTRPPGTGSGITVEDGRIYLAAGTYGLHIMDYALLPRPRLRIHSDRSGEVTLTIENVLDLPYTVETSTNLLDNSWRPFISVHEPGPSSFKDATSGRGRKFYRIVQ